MLVQQTLEAMQLRADIEARGYAEFEHHISKDAIEFLIQSYADFTLNHPDPAPATMDTMLANTPENPEELNLDVLDYSQDQQTEWHKYRTNVPHIGKPDGYTSRSFQAAALKATRGLELDEDPKEFYHFTPVHYAKMAQHHKQFGWGAIPPEVGRLDTAFGPIHRKAVELMFKICGLIEETHTEINQLLTPDSLRTSPLRLLFYHPTRSKMLGAAHYDKSVTTIQIAESHRGLRLAPTKEAKLEKVVRDDRMAAFFPSMMLMNSVGESTPYKPGWHDIVRLKTLNEGRNLPTNAAQVCARWALIFFGNAHNYVDPGKAATHRR